LEKYGKVRVLGTGETRQKVCRGRLGRQHRLHSLNQARVVRPTRFFCAGAGTSALAFVSGAAIGGVGWFTFLAYLASLGRKYLKPGMFRYIAGIAGVVLLLFAARFGFRAVNDIAGMFR